MRKILSFLLFIFISGQILKGQSYFHQYTPVETPQIEQSNPLIEYMQYMRQRDIESQFEKEQEQARQRAEGRKIVDSDHMKTIALCLDTEKIHDIRVHMQERKNGEIEVKVIGIKNENIWKSCSTNVGHLVNLLNSYPASDEENRSFVLSLMEVASLYFVYNEQFYITGPPQ